MGILCAQMFLCCGLGSFDITPAVHRIRSPRSVLMDVLLLRAIRQYLLGMCTTVSRPFVCKIQRFSRAMLLPRITQPDNDLPCPVKITSTTATVLVSRAHGPSHHGHTLHNKLRRKSFLSCKTRGRTRGPKFTVISIHNIKAYFV